MSNGVGNRERLEYIKDMKQVGNLLPRCRPNFIVRSDNVHSWPLQRRLRPASKRPSRSKDETQLLLKTSETQNYKTEEPWRQAKCLDSLAAICVSEKKREVISIGLRHSAQKLDFIVASNEKTTGRLQRGAGLMILLENAASTLLCVSQGRV